VEETAHSPRLIRFGTFEADLQTGELRKNGLKLKLSGQPFQVLAILLERPGEVVTRETLQNRLWPDSFVDFDHNLNTAINKIREALSDSAESPRFVETLPRRGYRFIAPASNVPVAFPLMASKVTAHGIQTKDKVIQRTEIPEADCSDGTSSSTVSHSGGEFVPPNPIEPFPSPARTLAKTRRQQMRVGFALGITSAALALGAMLLDSPRRASRNLAAPIRSVAVLPLENLTGDPSQEYFADGMTDALITELAQVRGLKVISRTSTMHYKGTRKTLPEIARELQVDAIVEGAVVHEGNEIKITAQLIRAATDTHVWAASYARVQRDVLRLQTEVAEQITRQIGNELTSVERKRSSSAATIEPEAFEKYLKGNYFFDKATPDAVRTGLHYYQAAIGKDPNYASAYAKIAECYLFLSLLSELSTAEAYVPAREAAEKAMALDENLGEAHHSLGDIAQWYDWDWIKADREYTRAIELNSNDASARLGYSNLLLFLGKPKASAEELRKARELDPISLTMYVALVYQLYISREYDQALLEARKGLELYPDAPLLHSLVSGIYTQTAQPRLAAEEALKTEEYWGASQERMAALRHAYKTAGAQGLLRTRIGLNRKSAGQRYLDAYDIAHDYAVLGDKDHSLYWLERLYRVHDLRLPYFKIDPVFESVRADPRFLALMKRAGIPQ